MKRRILCLLLSLVTVLSIGIGCNADTKGVGSVNDTATNQESSASKEEIKNTEDVSVETNKPDPNKTVRARKNVYFKDLGLKVVSFSVSDPDMVDCEIFKDSLLAYIYETGTVEIKVEDCFGHEAAYRLTTSDKLKVSVDIYQPAEKFIEVSQYGAKADNTTDDKSAFQAAIDAAKPGETVYVYAGFYYVSLLTMREGVTLKMQTAMTDAHEGYMGKISSAVNQGKMAVLRGIRFLNNGNQMHGSEGTNNFTISGGVLDMDNTTRGAVIFGCADNVRLENIIFKDIKNNHAIQFTGCTNSTISNCLFAGYVMDTVFTREVVQVEPSTPGATGSTSNGNIPPLWFYAGEYYLPENITIDHCYFGKSDEAGAPLMAIGHHSQVGSPNVTGFKITNNLFDECMYAAIRYDNVVDVEISGNTFISTSLVKNVTGFSDATNPAFITFYHHTGKSTYTNVVTNTTITEALEYEQAGIHNVRITDNVFKVGMGSDKRIFYYNALNKYTPGATYSSTEVRRQEMDHDTPYMYSGYFVRNNYGQNVTFSNNEIIVEGQPEYSDFLIYVTGVYGFTANDNKVTLGSGVKFTSNHSSCMGAYFSSNHLAEAARTYTVNAANCSQTIRVRYGDKVLTTVSTKASLSLTLVAAEHSDLELSTDKAGNLYVDIVCEDGYAVSGLVNGSSAVPDTVTLSANATISVVLAKL